jgi:hypothetical protein
MKRMRRIESIIIYITILLSNNYVSRGAIEKRLLHRYKLTAVEVTALLAKYFHEDRVECNDIKCSNNKTLFYGINKTIKDYSEIVKAQKRKNKIFNPSLGLLGEKYVRALLVLAGYKKVTRKKDLGRVWISASERIDILATYTAYGLTINLLVEVKNQRDVIYPGNDLFEKLMERALRLRRLPVLIASYVSHEAKNYCISQGIVVLELGHQVVEKSHKKQVKNLPETVLEPSEYMLINSTRPFQHGLWPEAQEHLETISRPEWVLNEHATWRARHPEAI